jgi:hypothetical protein
MDVRRVNTEVRLVGFHPLPTTSHKKSLASWPWRGPGATVILYNFSCNFIDFPYDRKRLDVTKRFTQTLKVKE